MGKKLDALIKKLDEVEEELSFSPTIYIRTKKLGLKLLRTTRRSVAYVSSFFDRKPIIPLGDGNGEDLDSYESYEVNRYGK